MMNKKFYFRKHKLLIILSNCDLVPKWVVKFWMRYFAKYFPVLAISSVKNQNYGIKAILTLLKNFFAKADKKKIKKIYVSGAEKTDIILLINNLNIKVWYFDNQGRKPIQKNIKKKLYGIMDNIYIIELVLKSNKSKM